MNWFYLGALLLFTYWTLPAPLEAFIAQSTGCHHNGTWYADKSLVPTVEKCLNCQCNKKTLVCRLKVCPEMPMPPPRGCVVVQKKHTCCPYLSCARLEAFYKIPITRRIIAYLDHYERESIDRVVNENMLQRRSDDSDVDMFVCVKNGTVYKSGSAMSSSNLCSYCYCIGGTEKCVKPKCMLPVEGCKPIFVDSTCCPVRYDCSAKTFGKSSQEVRYRKTSNKHFQRMSQRLQRNRGCTVDMQFYAEGQKMKSDPDKPCDICFCIRGNRRCAPKKCSPALKNCIPVVPKGQCCPSSYDCGSQRDYRRAQSSRQFNLFSLLFGKDEDKDGSSTAIPVQYPHDRDPALTGSANNFKTHQQVMEASSEKSILDTIREGLEFIDGNANHMLEENLDLVNLQAKRESVPAEKIPTEAPIVNDYSPTTEVSFLDLILGESSNVGNEKEEEKIDSSTIKTTTAQNELSWVDILLGPSDEEHQNSTHNEQKSELSKLKPPSLTTIERLDEDIEELGTTGEILVGIEDVKKELPNQVKASNSTEQITTTEKPITSTTMSTPISTTQATSTTTTLKTTQTASTAATKVITTQKPIIRTTIKTVKPTKPFIKPIPLHIHSEVQKQTSSPLLPSKNSSYLQTLPTIKPIKNNGLLAVLLDGINDMLNSEKVSNGSISNLVTNLPKPTIVPTKSAKPMPFFKPLPTQKTHTRINSKIANLTVTLPSQIITKQQSQNITFKPLPNSGSKLPQIFKINQTTTTTMTTTSATTTTTTTQKPKTSTTVTTSKPLIIKTNPTILEAEPLDDSTELTLPPSLPNLKIIPFLPTDAVETTNSKPYDYYQSNSELYDDAKLYPAITENYASFAVDLDDDNKAKYIYKFKIEGPETEPISSTIPKPSSDLFLKYNFVEKNGFSPPTKTEGGFVPKEPLIIDDDAGSSVELNASKNNEIYAGTVHIINLTTAENFGENLTNIIDITTPDPFKDVIHTEPPPNLAVIMQDKSKIETTTQKSNVVSSTTTESSSTTQKSTTLEPNSNSTGLEDEVESIETFFNILFKDVEQHSSTLPPKLTTISGTIPPFKSLPQTTMKRLSVKPTTISKTTERLPTTLHQTTKRPQRIKSTPSTTSLKNKTKSNITRRPTTLAPSKPQSKHRNSTITTIRKTTTPVPSTLKTIEITTKITTTTQTPTTKLTTPTITTTMSSSIKPAVSITTTHNPFLMSPFDKLPFMDASFEIKRQTPVAVTTAVPLLPAQPQSPIRLDGLDTAYEISNAKSITATTKTTTTTTTVHPPIVGVGTERPSNNLIDPTGILKLAGCNIYGRMYRVGRIILELSSPCVECKCTETGVKCGQLDC